MGQGSKGAEQEQRQSKQSPSREELRKRAKDVLERANQLIKETGKPREPENSGEGDT